MPKVLAQGETGIECYRNRDDEEEHARGWLLKSVSLEMALPENHLNRKDLEGALSKISEHALHDL